MSRKTPDQQLETLKEQRDRLDARIRKKSAQVRTALRKQDTRRKIITGAIALEHADRDPEFARVLTQLLKQHVKESDRKLFGM